MTNAMPPRTLVANFNSPELNQLALALAQSGQLAHYVRPYINKGRAWERAIEALPWMGPVYANTLGRRRINDAALAERTHEAGVLADIVAAMLVRFNALPASLRGSWAHTMHESVRRAVARSAGKLVHESDCVVAYPGFALPAFEILKTESCRKAVLNYPIAHHRHHRQVRREEQEREPEFACTWPGLDDWPAGYEDQIDEEISLADGILVGSSYVRDSFRSQGIDKKKIEVIPYGVDLDTFTTAPVTRSGQFRAVFAGQLSQRKGIAYLLRGYRKFQRADSRLTLVGNWTGPNTPFKPYTDLFEHVPHQTRPALAQRYRESDVFVFPTLLEGMPLVVLEAMACGLPVIVTANGPSDIVRDGVDGFVIPERDEDAICDRLDRLYRDPDLRIEMGRNARNRALEFSWNAYATKAQAFLAGLVNAPAPQRSAQGGAAGASLSNDGELAIDVE